MSSLVFGCPNCQQPFQVEASQAGQVLQCPSCAQAVEIPANAFASQAPQPPVSQEPQAFGCPSCGGQFGVTPDMDGQQVACPHCQAPTMIQLSAPSQPAPPQTAPEPEPEDSPLIKTNLPVSRSRKKKLRKIAKSKGPAKINQDLFAPGHTEEPEASAPLTPPTAPPPPTAPAPPTPAPSATTQPSPPPTKPETPKPRRSKAKPDSTQQSAAAPSTSAEQAASSKTPAPLVPKLRGADPNIEPKSESVSPEASTADASDVAFGEAEVDSRPSIAHLLPPMFDVLDPTRMGVGRGNEKFKVFLPDGEGGTAQIDNRVLRVKHGAKEVSLVSLTPEERARQRLIQNIIAILIGIGVMALAFTILM